MVDYFGAQDFIRFYEICSFSILGTPSESIANAYNPSVADVKIRRITRVQRATRSNNANTPTIPPTADGGDFGIYMDTKTQSQPVSPMAQRRIADEAAFVGSMQASYVVRCVGMLHCGKM